MLAPVLREDLREWPYPMVGSLVHLSVTVLSTAELTDSYTEQRLHDVGAEGDEWAGQEYVLAAIRRRRAKDVHGRGPW